MSVINGKPLTLSSNFWTNSFAMSRLEKYKLFQCLLTKRWRQILTSAVKDLRAQRCQHVLKHTLAVNLCNPVVLNCTCCSQAEEAKGGACSRSGGKFTAALQRLGLWNVSRLRFRPHAPRKHGKHQTGWFSSCFSFKDEENLFVCI